MFFGGGFPFGFGQHPGHQEDEENQEQSLYDLLGVSEDATSEQLAQKHKQLKEKYSPGSEFEDAENLQQINEAFQILSDPKQRKLYDQQMKQRNQIFEMMHGGHGQGKKNKSNELPKMQPTKRAINVSLQKIYKGGNIPLTHQRARKCEVCEGKGGKDVKQCSTCKGQGAVAKMVQVGPGMYTQMAQNCKDCEGKGDIFGEGGKCEGCQGNRIVKKTAELQVPIPKGAPPGHIITLEGDGNQVHNTHPGDLILVVQQQHNEHFTRKGADLFYKKSITLIQSLLGFNFVLNHLDGKQYTVYTRPGQIVGDSEKKVVKNMGMPFFGDEEEHGNLIIQFKVVMPKRGELNPEQLAALSSILPGKMNERPKDEHYDMLEDYQREHANTNEQGGRKEQDEQEEQQGGIGCQAQ